MTVRSTAEPATRRWWPARVLAAAAALALAAPAGAFDDLIDSPMYRRPDLPVPTVVSVFPDAARGLWLRALDRPEAETRARAADMFGLARRRGATGLEVAVPRLVAELDRDGQDPTVRLAAARALVALDARDAAPALLKQARAGGVELRGQIEPALAKWGFAPARAAWLERLQAPEAAPRSAILAMQCLADVGETKACDRLRALALARTTPAPIRLAAARALGRLRGDGLEADAAGLARDGAAVGLTDRLVAASLLSTHRGDRAVALLTRLARDPEPAVATVAVARLLALDAKHVIPLADGLLASPDPGLRGLGIAALRREPAADRLKPLADRLDDRHPDVRVAAREALREVAGRAQLRPAVLAEASRILAAESWRGQEQAAILVARLGHRPAAGRLVELLTAARPEVYITAAWALRTLDVPETLPAVLRHVEAEVARQLAGTPADGRDAPTGLVEHQLSQLNQFLGTRKYAPADTVLREFVPKRTEKLGPEARAAGIWALGLLHEGKADDRLAAALEGRLRDIGSIPPEDDRCRRMSALTIGRLKAAGPLPALREFAHDRKPAFDMVANACAWAIERITGEPVPPAETFRRAQLDWFIRPLDLSDGTGDR
jgi:HEAT repeat protein